MKRPITPATTTTISPSRTVVRHTIASWLIPRNPQNPPIRKKNSLFCQSFAPPSPALQNILTTPVTLCPTLLIDMDSSHRARTPTPTGVLIPASDQSTEAQDLSLTLTVTQSGIWEDETTEPAPRKSSPRNIQILLQEFRSGKRHMSEEKPRITLNLLDPFVRDDVFLRRKVEQWTCQRLTDDTLRWRTCLLSRDTFNKNSFFCSLVL